MTTQSSPQENSPAKTSLSNSSFLKIRSGVIYLDTKYSRNSDYHAELFEHLRQIKYESIPEESDVIDRKALCGNKPKVVS
jgi:hypothetical protein